STRRRRRSGAACRSRPGWRGRSGCRAEECCSDLLEGDELHALRGHDHAAIAGADHFVRDPALQSPRRDPVSAANAELRAVRAAVIFDLEAVERPGRDGDSLLADHLVIELDVEPPDPRPRDEEARRPFASDRVLGDVLLHRRELPAVAMLDYV